MNRYKGKRISKKSMEGHERSFSCYNLTNTYLCRKGGILIKEIIKTGAVMKCSFGSKSCVFRAMRYQTSQDSTIGTIEDTSTLSIASFGTCKRLFYPEVKKEFEKELNIAITIPCVSTIKDVWKTNATESIDGIPVLSKNAKVKCIWGGTITFVKKE